MLLTIGLIVKNEGRHLRSCLTHLQPLRDKVPSELVIVDTGSTDSTVGIAKEFTDRVLFWEWNNSFADARNFCMDNAKGEWYLSLDADEYFEDLSGVIRFFTGEWHLASNTATIEIRSYSDDGNSYRLSRHIRIIRMTPISRFVGDIHELLPTLEPTEHLSGHVRHLGYETAEIAQAKRDRNFPIIEASFKKNPNDINAISYMANDCLGRKDFGKAEMYIGLGFDAIEKGADRSMLYAFHELKVSLSLARQSPPENYAAALLAIGEALEKLNDSCYGTMKIWDTKAGCHYHLGEYAEAAAAYEKCYSMDVALAEGKLDMEGSLVVVGKNISSGTGTAISAFSAATCYEKLEDYDAAFKWLNRIPVDSPALIGTYLSQISKSGQTARFQELFDRIALYRGGREKQDKIIASFDEIVLGSENGAFFLAPFFGLYSDVQYAHIKRTKPEALSAIDPGGLSDIQKIAVFIHLAREAKKWGKADDMVKNVKRAMGVNSRLAPVIMEEAKKLVVAQMCVLSG